MRENLWSNHKAVPHKTCERFRPRSKSRTGCCLLAQPCHRRFYARTHAFERTRYFAKLAGVVNSKRWEIEFALANSPRYTHQSKYWSSDSPSQEDRHQDACADKKRNEFQNRCRGFADFR